jgi:hypothetical protein
MDSGVKTFEDMVLGITRRAHDDGDVGSEWVTLDFFGQHEATVL